MECCQTTQKLSFGIPCQPCMDLDLGSQTALDFIKFFFSPEASNNEGQLPGPTLAPWMGAVKALFWTAMAMAGGAVLATLCR